MITDKDIELYNKILKRKPTRIKTVALAQQRPWIPTCEHDGCIKAAVDERGSGKRNKVLCAAHFKHPDYRRLRPVYCADVLRVITPA